MQSIPDHVQKFVDKLFREIDLYGYAIWRGNLYDPPKHFPLKTVKCFSQLRSIEWVNNDPDSKSSTFDKEKRCPRRRAQWN